MLLFLFVFAAHASVYQFTYKAEFTKPSSNFETWEAWIPAPQNEPGQKIVKSEIHTSAQYEITTEKRFGNKMIHLTKPKKFPLSFEAVYTVERKPVKIQPDPKRRGWNPKDFLAPDKKIPLQGRIAELGTEQAKGARSDSQKIKNMYHYVVNTMKYDKSGTGWGNGDALWACDSKRGNCTDFHSLFIGMARSQKIPARFEIGFPMPDKSGAVAGYHCWAWAHEHAKGWLPLDASEANQHGKTDRFLGHLPDDRIGFTVGRDLVLSPPQKGEALNFFIYPYVEVDGQRSNAFTKEFAARRMD